MNLFKRISNFTAKIGTPGNSKLQNTVNLLKFLGSKPGLRFVKDKVKQSVLSDLHNPSSYHNWIQHRTNFNILQSVYLNSKDQLVIQPVFSVVIPVYDPQIKYLAQAIDSVINQLYPNWQLCIADDNSPNPAVQQLLKKYEQQDSRIKVAYRTTNGHISACTNSAISLATGDYILFMDHDDLLTANCLAEFAKHINQFPENQLIYSDEDKIDEKGIYSMPHFKPDWAPDNLLSRNYIGHVVVMKKSLVDALHGVREGFEGSQDYDILLRATEQTSHIGHIPKVLYHWRIHASSVAMNTDSKPYAYVAALKAIQEALDRRPYPGTVEEIPRVPGGYRIRYKIQQYDKVSIIIPTKDQAHLLKTALDSIVAHTRYPSYEIILLNNNSTSPEFFDLVKEFAKQHGDIFTCYDALFPFNFSKLINFGVSKSTGKYLLFLNNDIEVMHADWLDEMVSFAQRKHTGAVGAKLLFPDHTIQHAGVVVGMGGAAAHAFARLPQGHLGYFNYLVSLNNYASVTAACMLCRRDVFDEVGGFDETMDVEYNDIDFCLKLLAAGYYNLYVPNAVLYHHESATRGHPFHSKNSFTQHEKDKKIFTDRWRKYIDHDPFYNPNLSLNDNDFRINPLAP